MLFTKIKWDGNKVELKWETNPNDDTVTHELTSYDPPEPEFEEALQELIPDVLALLELPEGYGEDMDVTGLSISYSGDSDRMGVVVTCQKELTDANSPLVLNTPHMKEEDPEDPNPGQMTRRMKKRVEGVQGRASRYVNGFRSQQDLFGEDEPAAEPARGGMG